MSLRCSYHHGMFANEPPMQSFAASYWTLNATCHHEAGHAVVGYMLGFSLDEVAVCVRLVDGQTGYEGHVKHNGDQKVDIWCKYRPLHFRHGLSATAGPAAERRYRHDTGTPQQLLEATKGDHDIVQKISKALERTGRNRFAFERHVWGHAQCLVEREDVWDAITAVAGGLFEEAMSQSLDDEIERWSHVSPYFVYRECRNAGLRRGQLAA